MEKFYVAKQVSSDDTTIVVSELTYQQAVLMKCRRLFSVHVDGEPKFKGNGEAVTRFIHLMASAMGWKVNGLWAIDVDDKVRISIHAQED